MSTTPHRRADDLTPKDDAQLEDWMVDVTKRVRAAHRRRDRRVRAAAAFIVIAGLLFAYRLQVTQHRLDDAARRDRVSAYRQCQDVNDNARKLNDLIRTIVMRIEQSDVPPAEKARAADQYRAVLQTLPVCRKP